MSLCVSIKAPTPATMHASESASVDHPMDSRVVMRINGQRCDACKNGLVGSSAYFCLQLTHPLQPRDVATLILADHARLGERVQNTASTLRMHVRCRENSPPRPPLGSLGALVGEKIM